MAKYTIGLDYGTQSGRAVLLDLTTGNEVAAAELVYPHGVMDYSLPDGTLLQPDWALEHPKDYLDVLTTTIPAVLRESGVDPEDIIGLALDVTSCTLVPTCADGTPLCFLPEFAHEPHAFIKLWKHHAAQPEADKLNAIAAQRGEAFVARYGEKTSSEWMFPKVWQVLDECPEVYAAADRFIEAGDWLVWQLTGVEARSTCAAGYKALWHKQTGYPEPAFFRALDPRLEQVVADKLEAPLVAPGGKVGELTAEMAEKLGLKPGIAVAAANVDAHVTMPVAGITEPGQMLMIMGTSTCHMVLDEGEHIVPGICGYVEDGILPGLVGYEAGQPCVGDMLGWYVKNAMPAEVKARADALGMDGHQYLTQEAAKLVPGENGLIALDWWNGNRSVLVDGELSGVMVGMTMTTQPAEIYRALIEATAFGTRRIIEQYEAYGVKIDKLYAAGGIARKNPLMMQIYADVTGREIAIVASRQAPAVGSAMFAAVAAGKAAGGFDTIQDAARAIGRTLPEKYEPNPDHAPVYDALYAQYVKLHDLFAGDKSVMQTLKQLRSNTR